MFKKMKEFCHSESYTVTLILQDNMILNNNTEHQKLSFLCSVCLIPNETKWLFNPKWTQFDRKQ